MKEHNCFQNRFDDEIKVIYGPSIDNDWKSWILQISRIARAKDVYDGESEIVGEILSQNSFVIN